MTQADLQVEGDKLKVEARFLLKNLLGIQPDDGSSNMIQSKRVDKLIDCIVGCALLEAFDMLQKSTTDLSEGTNVKS